MYNFKQAPGQENTFLFETDLGLSYEVKFKHTPYLFEDAPDYQNDVYELSVILAKPGPSKTPPRPGH